MTYEEFRRQLGKAGVSVKEFTGLVRLSNSSIPNYAKEGQVPDHWAIVAALMGEMAENDLDFKSVLRKIEIRHKKARGSATKGKFGGDKQRLLFPSGQ